MTAASHLPKWAVDPDLRRFVEAGDGDAVATVIVEASVPPVRISAPRAGGGPIKRTLLPDPSSTRAGQGLAHLKEIEQALEGWAGARRLTVLPGAMAVVAEVTAGQVRQLAAMPAVHSLRLNREWRREA